MAVLCTRAPIKSFPSEFSFKFRSKAQSEKIYVRGERLVVSTNFYSLLVLAPVSIQSFSLLQVSRLNIAYFLCNHAPLVKTSLSSFSACETSGLFTALINAFSSGLMKYAKLYRSFIAWPGSADTRCRQERNAVFVSKLKQSPIFTIAHPSLGSIHSQFPLSAPRICRPNCFVKRKVKEPRSVCGMCEDPRSDGA